MTFHANIIPGKKLDSTSPYIGWLFIEAEIVLKSDDFPRFFLPKRAIFLPLNDFRANIIPGKKLDSTSPYIKWLFIKAEMKILPKSDNFLIFYQKGQPFNP